MSVVKYFFHPTRLFIYYIKGQGFATLPHTPLEGLSGSVQFARLMTFTQLFFDISGTQNRKDQNFLTSTFSVIAILRYPTFSLLFLVYSDIAAKSFQRNFYYFPCQLWQDVLRELKLLEIIFDIYCHQLVKKFLEKVAPPRL